MFFAHFCELNPDPVPEWFGKFDEQVITDCMNEALGNSEGRADGAAMLRELASTGLRLVAYAPGQKKPVPIRLRCPACGELHIDEGEFATKVHHTHACQNCGEAWRPAVEPTVGVRFLPGFKNEKESP